MATNLEVSQMRKQMRDMEVHTSQAIIVAERDKSELEIALLEERNKCAKLQKYCEQQEEEIDGLKCDNSGFKQVIDEFTERLKHSQQENAKEQITARQKIMHYQQLAHAIEDEYRVKFEQFQYEAELQVSQLQSKQTIQ